MAQLDVAEAADLFRDRREPDRDVMVLGVELGQELIEQRLVIGNQPPLGLALDRIAERIEPRAAQEFELGEQPQQRENPGTERDLAWLARGLVLARQQRRGKMQVETQSLAA